MNCKLYSACGAWAPGDPPGESALGTTTTMVDAPGWEVYGPAVTEPEVPLRSVPVPFSRVRAARQSPRGLPLHLPQLRRRAREPPGEPGPPALRHRPPWVKDEKERKMCPKSRHGSPGRKQKVSCSCSESSLQQVKSHPKTRLKSDSLTQSMGTKIGERAKTQEQEQCQKLPLSQN